ncbi:MAG: glycosyltransferase family 39 protein [Pseudomonadota bacterium]|nr:glycosyltransferase family 39 protein [Pseudomonadota bacterium]
MTWRLLCWLIIAFACFWGIGAYPLLDNNEGLYASIARYMLESGDFIIPRLNGVPYIEKPPMLYWLMAASMKLFGVNEWGARLPTALALFATAWLMQRFLSRHARAETGTIAALLLATSLPLAVIGRTILCDMLMTCFVSAALTAFYEWRISGNHRALVGFYGLLALAVLTKGFVAVILAGGSILVFLLWQRTPWREYFRLLSLPGIALFLIIAAPWHIAASLEEPDFAWFYFINEHVNRFLGTREPHDYYTGPAWYYLPRIAAYLLPWTPFMVLLMKKPIQDSEPETQIKLHRFLWSWFLFFLAFFSLSGGKANYYVIAGMPPFIMLLALRIQSYIDAKSRALPAIGSVILVLIAAIPIFAHRFCGNLYPVCQLATPLAIAAACAYALASGLLLWRLERRWVALVIGAHAFLLLPLLIAGVNLSADRISQKPVADFMKPYQRIAMYQNFEELSAMAFYIHSPLVMVDSVSADLLYGQKRGQAAENFLSLKQWTAMPQSLPLVVRNTKMPELTAIMPNDPICPLQRFTLVTVVDLCKRIAHHD